MYAVDSEKYNIVEYIIDTYPVDLWAIDQIGGNNMLHIAVKDKNHDLARLLYEQDSAKCLT